jgi:hypothetical protein
VSAIFAFRADQRAGRAERREEERHVRERDHAQASRRAGLDVSPRGFASEDDERTAYDFVIRNRGPASAHEVQAWLVDESGEIVSTREPLLGMTLAKDEESGPFRIVAGKHEPRSLRYVVAWTDDEGPHEERTPARPIDVGSGWRRLS